MLVLSRRPGESLLIGDDVEVKVLEVCGDRVRIGVTAPDNVAVDRNEVREREDYEPGRRS